MEQNVFLKSVVEFNKSSFDNTYDALVKGQEQTEAMINTMFDTGYRFSKETKTAMDQWAKVFQKGREDFKEMVNMGFQSVEKFFTV